MRQLFRHTVARAVNWIWWLVAVSALLWGLQVAYLFVSFMVFEDGTQDPVYQVTGMARADQLAATLPLLVLISIAILYKAAGYLVKQNGKPDYLANRKTVTVLYALFFLNCLAASLPAILAELNSQFWGLLFGFFAVVLLLQVLMVYLTLTVVKNFYINLGLLVSLSVFNLNALYLFLLEIYLGQTAVTKFNLALLLALPLILLYLAAGQRVSWARRINVVLLITILSPVILILSQVSRQAPTTERMRAFQNIKFARKPNVHIVSFDALIPPSLAKELLNLDAVPYEGVLTSRDATVFKNAFASYVPTERSLNSVMRLSHPAFEGPDIYDYFAGRANSPVANIFSENGYKISTGFSNLALGLGGKFVDDYHTEPDLAVRNSSLCALAVVSVIEFFGFCALASTVEEPQGENTWPATVADIIRKTGDDATPWLTFHYIFYPIGHAEKGFNISDADAFEDYREKFLKQSKNVAPIVDQLKNVIRAKQDNSILFVFGDHGALLSRTVVNNVDKGFFVKDQHGILAAVLLNKTDCSSDQLNYYQGEGFITPERILAGLIRCLSVDPTKIDAAVEFSEAYDMSNFLYE